MQSFHPPRPHPRPPRPALAQGYLVQKIIACERRTLPCLCAEWHFDHCADHAIRQVCASGSPAWTLENDLLHLSLPVSVRLCDPCGSCRTQSAVLDAQTDLPRHFLFAMDDPRTTLIIWPCIRLVHAECTCSGCYRAQLQAVLEICLLRHELLHCGGCRPECPQLPLYPQPMC